ncbi:MAG: alkaline phosphatase PhoX, partial [Bacteroidota bacterium]
MALGRCSHECATVKELEDGRLVVYTGDDKNDEHLYKFISSKPGSLREGTLYVANLEVGMWIPVDVEQQPLLMAQFKTQTEALVYLRESA